MRALNRAAAIPLCLLLAIAIYELQEHVRAQNSPLHGAETASGAKPASAEPQAKNASHPGNAVVTLGNYPNTAVNTGGNSVITPDAAPVDTNKISVSTNTNFKGVLSADPVTGAVRVTNPHPAGTYTVTVQAFGTGNPVTSQFELTVNNVPTCSNLTFQPYTTFTAGDYPTGVAVGDFNNDGTQDVATGNLFGGDVSVLIGSGSGTFAAAVHYDLSGASLHLAVGDLNLDGKQDIVAAGGQTDVLLGNGDGTFAPAVSITSDLNNVRSVAIADVNSDAIPDIVTSWSEGLILSIGNGDGTFTSTPLGTWNSGGVGGGSVFGDFNNDGDVDIGAIGGPVRILLGNGDGTFAAPVEYTAGYGSITTGDLDNDGDQDLVTQAVDGNWVLLGNGDGTFAQAVNYPTGVGASIPIVGDFDTDGNLDIASSNTYGPTVSVIRGNGDGTFSLPVTTTVGFQPVWLAAGDFNADGLLDIVVTSHGIGGVSVLIRGCPEASVQGPSAEELTDGSSTVDMGSVTVTSSSAPGTFTIRNVGTASMNLGTVTVDGANAADFSLNTQQTALSLEPNGSTTFSVTFTPSAPGTRSAVLHLASNDGDEDSFDINLTGTGATSQQPPPAIGTYADTSVTAAGSVTIAPSDAPTNATSLTVSSVSNFKGILSIDQGTGTVSVSNAYPVGAFPVTVRAIGDGGTVVRIFLLTVQAPALCSGIAFGGEMPVPTGTNISGITSTDLNADGNKDLVLLSSGFQVIKVAMGTGNGGFSAPVDYQFGFGARHIMSSDLNNDGKPDIVVLGDPGVRVYLGNGDGTLAAPVSLSAGSTPLTGTIADFDSDGKKDVVYVSSSLYLLRGNGDGTFAPAVVFPSDVSIVKAAAADLNSDGKQDLVYIDIGAMYVLLGNGDGTFGEKVFYPAGAQPRELLLDDANNDGHLDALVGGPTSSAVTSITMIPGNGNGTFAAPGQIPLGFAPRFIGLSDFNDDGRNDLVVDGGGPGRVNILTGNANGGFVPAAQVNMLTVNALLVDDLDGNGWTDLAVGMPSKVSLFLRSCPEISVEHPAGTVLTDGESTVDFGSEMTGVSGAPRTVSIHSQGIGPLAVNGLTVTGINASDFIVNTTGMATSVPQAGSTTFTLTFRPGGEGQRSARLHIANGDFDESPFDVDLSGTGTANPALNIGTYPSASVGLGGSTTVVASGSAVGITSMSVAAGGGFSGTLAVSPSTGLVSVTNAGPGSGTYPITVTGFGPIGSVNRTFMLTVTAPTAPCSALSYRRSTVGIGASGVMSGAGFVVADFNQDGHQDLAISGTAGAVIRLGNGDGSFAEPVIYGPAAFHTSIATSDLNSDGHLDLVIAVPSGSPRIFLGNGDGAFMNGVPVNSPVVAQDIAVADMNSDGRPDIVATLTNNNVSLLPGVGNGTFGTGSNVAFSGGTLKGPAVLEDLDKDGLRDLAVISGSNTLGVRKGTGGGSFGLVTSYTFASDMSRLAAADLNSDGRPDLVVSHSGAKTVSVMSGSESGSFESPVAYATSIRSEFLAVGDLNSDGRQDIAVTSSDSNELVENVVVLTGRSDGTFHIGAKVGGGWGFFAVGDFNNDGFQDFVTKRRGNSSLNIMLKGCPRVAFDFDGNGRANPAVWRPSNNWWYVRQDTGGFDVRQWGVAGDKLTPADYDADGKDDIAIWRPSTGAWYIVMSATQTVEVYNWGVGGDIPKPYDWNNDGKTDMIVYRTSNNTWYTRLMHISTDQFLTSVYGTAGEIPLIGDFDHDLRTDRGFFRPSDGRWRYARSSGGVAFEFPWGVAGDIPVPADYDGDGATDLAVFRPSNSRWYIIGSSAGWIQQVWGQAGDIPAPADYDGDGKTDLAIFRPSTGRWHIIRSTEGWATLSFGQNGDVPIPSVFLQQ